MHSCTDGHFQIFAVMIKLQYTPLYIHPMAKMGEVYVCLCFVF